MSEREGIYILHLPATAGLSGLVKFVLRYLLAKKSGSFFRVGIFLDFVRLTTYDAPPWGVRAGSQAESN